VALWRRTKSQVGREWLHSLEKKYAIELEWRAQYRWRQRGCSIHWSVQCWNGIVSASSASDAWSFLTCVLNCISNCLTPPNRFPPSLSQYLYKHFHEHPWFLFTLQVYPISCRWNSIHRVSKRALQLRKSIQIYSEDIHNVLKCQNVAKHFKFYLGYR
jgi:hypothetical protein